MSISPLIDPGHGRGRRPRGGRGFTRPRAALDQRAKEFLDNKTLPANMHLVVDPDYRVTNLYGLRWDAPHETAYPTTFILARGGKVAFRKISHEHGDRLSAADALKQLTVLPIR